MASAAADDFTVKTQAAANVTKGLYTSVAAFALAILVSAWMGKPLARVFLNAFLTFLVVLISWKIELRPQLYFTLVQFLCTAVTGVFISLDLLVFFLFWELVLVPMYFLIGGWGYDRRIYATL